MNLRRLHRWVAIVAAVFLLNIAITGTILAWGSIKDSRREARAPDQSPALPADDLLPLLRSTYQVARTAAPDAPIVSIRIGMGDGEPRGAVIIGGEHSGMLFIDPVRRGYLIGPAGAVTPGGAALDTHSLLKRLHRGDVYGGLGGRGLMIVSGFCLLFLLYSALGMYIDGWRQRRRLGRHGWFWR